jgi:hypothetical protein
MPSLSTTYFDTWIKTAGNGNIIAEYAFAVDRMCLACKACKVTLTCAQPPDAETIDFSVQEFVKLHRHDGKYESEKEKLEKAQHDLQLTLKDIAEDNNIKREILRRALLAAEMIEASAKKLRAPSDKIGRKFR